MLKAISIAGLLATIALAYGCDWWVDSLHEDANQLPTIAVFLWQAGIANLLLATALLLLAWFVIIRAGKSWLVTLLFILIGLGVTFASPLTILVASTLPRLDIAEALFPDTRIFYTANFIAIIGIASFVFPRKANT